MIKKNEMHDIKLLFRYTPMNWDNGYIGVASWLIRLLSDTPYDHVEVLIDDYCYSASSINGIRRIHLDKWRKLYKDQKEEIRIRKSPYSEAQIIRMYEIQEGKGYDFAALPHHIIYIRFNVWVGKVKEKAKDKFYCSEFCAYVTGVKEWWKCGMREIYKLTSKL